MKFTRVQGLTKLPTYKIWPCCACSGNASRSRSTRRSSATPAHRSFRLQPRKIAKAVESSGKCARRGKHTEPATNTKDLRDQPAYGLAEAARYLKLPAATLRSWIAGRAYPRGKGTALFQPLIHPPKREPPLLSFWNLIEAHVLRALRTDHGISIQDVRKAVRYAERTLQIERLLLNKDLRMRGGRLLLEKYGELIDLPASGQMAMRKIFEDHLSRVEWGEWQFPLRLYPYGVSVGLTDRLIVIDPDVRFGRPTLAESGISTSVIADRIDAQEPPQEVANDYGLTIEQVEQAVLYERAA